MDKIKNTHNMHVKKISVFGITAVSTLLYASSALLVSAHGSGAGDEAGGAHMGGGMMGGGWSDVGSMGGWSLWCIVALVLAVIVVVMLITMIARKMATGGETTDTKSEMGALEVLEKRYAEGEITTKEFTEMKKVLLEKE